MGGKKNSPVTESEERDGVKIRSRKKRNRSNSKCPRGQTASWSPSGPFSQLSPALPSTLGAADNKAFKEKEERTK